MSKTFAFITLAVMVSLTVALWTYVETTQDQDTEIRSLQYELMSTRKDLSACRGDLRP